MRDLIWATLITTIGNGLSTTAATLYAIRVVHVSNSQLGVGLAVAAVIALFVGLMLGRAADELGSRNTFLAIIAFQGSMSLVYAFTRTYWLFLFAIIGLAVGQQGMANVRGALIAQITDPVTRVKERAFLRSVTNFGIGLGSILAGVAITIDTPTAYSTVIVIDAITFFISMIWIAKLPNISATVVDGQPTRSTDALRNGPFMLASFLTGLVCMHYPMLTLAVPLWIVQQTNAPHWVVAGSLVQNTLMIVLFQVRASRGTETPADSARVVRTAMAVIAASCLIYWSAADRGVWLAGLLIMLGAFVHAIGELRQASGTWGMGYGLTPGEAHGQYQAVWQSSFTIGGLIGPPLMAGFVVTHGLLGWSVLGAIYLLTGLAMPSVTRAALARNARTGH